MPIAAIDDDTCALHQRLTDSLEQVAVREIDITPLFFERFYAACPGERARFCNRASSEGLMVNEMLAMLLAQAAGEPWLTTMMRARVNTHHDHGDIDLDQYRIALSLLVDVLRDTAGALWPAAIEADWRAVAEQLFAVIARYH